MTATPKVYSEKAKTKAKESENTIFCMDDEEIFGKEIYALNFGKAIEEGLLTDYKVIILVLKSEYLSNVANNAIKRLKAEKTKLHNKLIDQDFVCKIIGTHKGLAKQDLITLDSDNQKDSAFKDHFDQTRSKRAIIFCRSIDTSKHIKQSFQTILECYDEELKKDSFNNLEISIDHIDGTMNAKERLDKLTKLDRPKENACNVLSNVRCLSEGVDVPALDSIVFFNERNAMVDIIQAVGRVMRKAPNKEMGYIILPITLSEKQLSNLDEAVTNTSFRHIWKVLKSLRSHDASLVDEATYKEKIRVVLSDDTPNEEKPKKEDKASQQKKEAQEEDTRKEQGLFDITTLRDLADAIYNAVPTKLGDKGYWTNFSFKTAKTVETLTQRLKAIFTQDPKILDDFLASLKENIHNFITQEEAIDMIASHIITKPIFDAIFGENMQDNPISKALDEILDRIKDPGLGGEETSYLNRLYENVRENAKLAKSQKSRQELIKDLYGTFLTTAFEKQSEKLGIVYTPMDVVDYILRGANALLQKHFQLSFNDRNVRIFDPFTGTGSFITRLIAQENGFISDENLKEKFEKDLFAQDILLLPYYIAMINITQSAQIRISSITRFEHIIFGDSLDYLEENAKKGSSLFPSLVENHKIKERLNENPIQVIIGNPPYSGGSKDENDNNKNIPHPELEKRVKETYGKDSKAKAPKSTRDTLIQSIRMASDRIENQGIIGFVVNGGFIDSTSADGFRKCLVKEFSDIYILNLRGNSREKEIAKKEGGNIFDVQVGVAIIFLIKDGKKKENRIHYYEVEDSLKKEKKLALLREAPSLESKTIRFYPITPNEHGDWINQREESFQHLIPLRSEKETQGIFTINSLGLTSKRDAWVYHFSKEELGKNMQLCIKTYREDLARFDRQKFLERHPNIKDKDRHKYLKDGDITTGATKISWTRALKKDLIKNTEIEDFSEENIRISTYRPFSKQYLYWHKTWNEEQYQLHKIFPNQDTKNLVITADNKSKHFSSLMTDSIPDLHFIGDAQAYPLYFYEEDSRDLFDSSDGSAGRREAISDYALNLFQEKLKDSSITKIEIFYYIYAIFHHKGYTTKYKNNLAKEPPRVGVSKDFKELSKLGKELADLHLNYESGEMYERIEYKDILADRNEDGYYAVSKMVRKGNIIIYNSNIHIQIPETALQYVINGKSAIDWIIDRYQKTIDTGKKGRGGSLIENDPNAYAGSKYIFELLLRVIRLSEKSVDLIEKIGKLDFE